MYKTVVAVWKKTIIKNSFEILPQNYRENQSGNETLTNVKAQKQVFAWKLTKNKLTKILTK